MNLTKTEQTPETINVDVPPEPPVGSVVLDALGVAWQSHTRDHGGRLWQSAGLRALMTFGGTASGWGSWAMLITERQPLTLIHRADA